MTALTVSRLYLGITVTLTLALVPAFAQQAERVVTLGGAVTEIAIALGAEARLVARDTTSTFPERITALPDVGYIRALSPENILALDPGLILAEGDAGPPEAVEVLKAAGIPFVLVPEAHGPEGVLEKIAAVAAALDLSEEGAVLAASVAKGLAATEARAAAVPSPRRVMFVLSMRGGSVMAAGAGTEADGIIRLAGGINAVTGFEGYKPLTDEAILAAAPDVILMMDRRGDMGVTDADIGTHPALGQTPAGQVGAVIRMDGMLMLGFGPRTPEAAAALHDAIYAGG